MRKKDVFYVMALMLGTFCTASSAQAEKLLRWKFAPGQKLQVQLTQRIETDTAFSNKPVKLTVEIAMDMTWTIDSVEENGEARISQTMDKIALKMTVPPATTVQFDSSDAKKPIGDAKELAAMVAPLIGKKFVTKFNARGQILEVTVPDETSNALLATSSSGEPSFFTKDQIRRLLGQSAAILPEKGVNVGEKWEESATLDSPLGKLKQVSTYTYEGEEDRNGAVLDKIRVDNLFEIPPPAANTTLPTVKEQSLSGVIHFNNVAGRVAESQLAQKMKTETKVRENLVSASASSTFKTVFSLPKANE